MNSVDLWQAEREHSLQYSLRPAQIVDARDRFPAVYVPVGPLEWHSFQNPFGLDGLVPYWLFVQTASRLGGIVMPPVFLGLDEDRTPEHRARWGLPESGTLFGMSFPALPLSSLYCDPEHLKRSISLCLQWARDNGFRYGIVLSHHGGRGNHVTCEMAANACQDENFRTLMIRSHELKDHSQMEYLGKHAGINETERVLGLHPELVDTSVLPEGELQVSEFGILHSEPVIPEELNPRHCDAARGQKQIEIAVEIICRKTQELAAMAISTNSAGEPG